jgi:hypothetical protein
MLDGLQKSNKQYLFNLGRKPLWAANLINRFIKRLLIIFKIRRLERFYQHFQRLKQENGEIGCKRSMRYIYYYNILKFKKFIRCRQLKLEEIKERLALLAIKNYYESNQLSFRLIIKRIKKYKRKIKVCRSNSIQNDKNGDGVSTRDQYTTRSNIFTNESSRENLKNPENLRNILECASLTSTEFVQAEKERKERIQNGLISYKVPKAKEQLPVLPYLYQKDILEEISPPSHYTTPTSALVSRMQCINPKRQSPTIKHVELPLIALSPKPVLKKIIFQKDNLPNFTKPTFSSTFSGKCEEVAEKIFNKRDYINTYKVINQTISTIQKKTLRDERSITVQRNRYSTRISEESNRNDFNPKITEYKAKIEHKNSQRAQSTFHDYRKVSIDA